MPLCGGMIPETSPGAREFDANIGAVVLLPGKANTVFLEHKNDVIF